MSTNTNNAGREGPGSENGSPHLTELVRQLKLTYRQAGNPSYRTIIRTTSIGLSTSTISRIFTARKPPKWENLTELLLALGVSREDIKTTWHRLWMLADNEANPLTGTDNAGGELLPRGGDRRTSRSATGAGRGSRTPRCTPGGTPASPGSRCPRTSRSR